MAQERQYQVLTSHNHSTQECHPLPDTRLNSPQMTREDELNYMKDQAEAIKGQLEEIESRMRDLEAEK